MYDFNWASAIARNTGIPEIVGYVKAGSLVDEALEVLSPIEEACKMLEVDVWTCNVAELISTLRR